MKKICYITDEISIEHMNNFWNKDMVCQNREEKMKDWIGGELYIQKCIYDCVNELDFVDIICDYKIEKLFKYDIVIVPGWKKLPLEYEKLKEKIYTFYFFENVVTNIKNIINPWVYNKKNKFLGIYSLPLEIKCNIKFSNNIRGLFAGKCLSHCLSKNLEYYKKICGILNLLKEEDLKIYSTVRNISKLKNIPMYFNKNIINYSNKFLQDNITENLGIISPVDFRFLLKHCKFIMFFHSSRFPPTLIEALSEKCIILSTADVIPEDLKKNNNVIIIDTISDIEIVSIIKKILNNDIKYNFQYFPKNYTKESMIKNIKLL